MLGMRPFPIASYACYSRPMDELLDIASVATYLGVSERTVYNKVRAGELPAVKVGRLWRVRSADLQAWLESGRRAPAPAAGPYPYADVAAPVAAEVRPVPTRAELEAALEPVTDQLERRLFFVALLSRGCETLGWPAPVIVGGHAAEFWSAGGYTTVDIDLVGASEPIAEVLGAWGFSRTGRHWYDDSLGLVVEAPGAQLTADEREHVVAVRIGGAVACVLGIEDLVVDRLNACVHWRREESCDVARALIEGARDDIDLVYLRRRASEEDVLDRLERVLTGGT